MDISIVLNKSFYAGELHCQQGDSEYVSQNKKADVTYNKFCSLRDEAVEYFRAIESERDELKSKLAEIEAQEPYKWENTNGNYSTQDPVVVERWIRKGTPHIALYTQPIANNSERITEQDARVIVGSAFKYYRATKRAFFTNDWLEFGDGCTLLAKLNEHREPVTNNKAEVPTDQVAVPKQLLREYRELIEGKKLNVLEKMVLVDGIDALLGEPLPPLKGDDK